MVFIGAGSFGLRCFQHILQKSCIRVVGVVTSPPRFCASSKNHELKNPSHDQFFASAQGHGVPVSILSQDMGDPHLLASVLEWKPDAFLVAGWYHIIPKTWLSLAPFFGLHASLLPDYCGWAPLVWAMINRETKTGITLFQMDAGVDSGPIAAQAEEKIRPDDTIETLYQRIEDLGLKLLDEALPKLSSHSLKLTPQPKQGRRVMPRRFPEDGLIDWQWESLYIDNWIRAQTRPYPGAFTCLDKARLTIWKARVAESNATHNEWGKVQRNRDGGYEVLCGLGAIELLEISLAGRRFDKGTFSSLFGQGGQKLGPPNR